MSKKRQEPQYFGDIGPSAWPGERLGLPKKGPLAIGRIGRRIGAIAVDWLLATVLAQLAGRTLLQNIDAEWQPTVTLTIFALMQMIFIPTIGGSIGHRIFGLRIIKLGGGWVGVWRPAVRTLLLLLVIPVLVWDSDQRGFHDKIAATALVLA